MIRTDLGFGLASISFNPDTKFADKLEDEIRNLLKKDKVIKKDFEVLSKIIKKETGLTFKFKLELGLSAYVHAPGVSQDHVFNYEERGNSWYVNQSKGILRPGDLVRGTVDRKHIKVTGVFSELEFISGIGGEYFKTGTKFSARMILAIMLHEFGHVFNYLILLSRTISTNYLLTEFVDRLFETEDETTRYELYSEYKSKGHVLEKKDEVVRSKSKEAAQTIIIRDQVRDLQSEMGHDLYDRRGNEALADQFAVRMGYGKELTQALKILYLEQGTAFSPFRRFMMHVLHVLYILTPPGIYALFYIISFFQPPDMMYDSDTDRIKVIRQQLSAMLREPNISRAEKKKLLRSIDEIEITWKDAKDFVSFSNIIYNNIVGRSVRGDLKMQQQLESLTNTRLSEAAARLEVS